MELYTKLKDIMSEAIVSHKPYSEMTKQEFKTYHKKNFELMNKWKLDYIKLFIKNFKHVFPEGTINLKKGDKGFSLKDLTPEQILDAWTFNQNRAKSYLFNTSNLGKEVDPDGFFMNVLDWTEGFAPKAIDNKVEQIRDIIIKRIDTEILNGKAPFDINIIGDWDDLKAEGFFEKYPHLK